VTGSFIFDADTQTFSDILLTSTASRLTYTQFAGVRTNLIGPFPGMTFLQPGVSPGESTIALNVDTITTNLLTDSGGLLRINPDPTTGFFADFNCTAGVDCAEGLGSSVSNWAVDGVSTLTGEPVAVPEPSTLALLTVSVAGFGFLRLTRSRKSSPRREAT